MKYQLKRVLSEIDLSSERDELINSFNNFFKTGFELNMLQLPKHFDYKIETEEGFSFEWPSSINETIYEDFLELSNLEYIMTVMKYATVGSGISHYVPNIMQNTKTSFKFEPLQIDQNTVIQK